MPAIALMGAFLFGSTFAGLTPAAAPAEPPLPGYSVSLTGYNAVPAQTKADPSTTANGGPSNPAVVAARSRDLADVLPFGTIIAIDGPTATSTDCGYSAVEPLIGYRVITDSMNDRIKNTIDILFNTKDNYSLTDGRTVNASLMLGNCAVTVHVVGRIDLAHVGNLPKTQKELAALVEGDPSLALR